MTTVLLLCAMYLLRIISRGLSARTNKFIFALVGGRTTLYWLMGGSSVEALVPGLNVPYGMQFKGTRQGVVGEGKTENGPGWRKMGTKTDKQYCFASLPGAGGKEFMGQVGGSCLGTGEGTVMARVPRASEHMFATFSLV